MANAQAVTFVYKGKNKQGAPVRGEIRGDSSSMVKAQLRRQGVIPSTVRKKPKPLLRRSKPIKPADIAVFTRQMATMMKAGVPLVQSFEIVEDGSEKETMRALIKAVREDVAAGVGLGNAMRKHPRHFDELYCNLIEAGEQSGSLETMLDMVAVYKEKNEALKQKIKKALTYPAAVVVVAIVVTAILLVKVVPVFAETFTGFGADLPAFTLFVLHISDFAQKWWFLGFIVAILALTAFREARLRSPKFSDRVDALTLKIPLIGSIVNEATVARVARTLATTFAAGVPLVEALESVAGSSGNAIYRDAILQVRDDVSAGVALAQAFTSSGLFPTLMLQLTSIGEESGALDDMMDKAATHFEDSVDAQVTNLTTLLEPLIMSVLGILVGGLLIAMYLPIFNLGNVVG
jgi:type IV pilus assembly protein PilC